MVVFLKTCNNSTCAACVSSLAGLVQKIAKKDLNCFKKQVYPVSSYPK